MAHYNLKTLLARGAALCALAACLVSVPALSQAATISYGDFGPVPPGIMFLDVKESSGTDPGPLYGAPSPFATGLNFSPAGFTSSAAGGAADITDGQLNFTIMGNGLQGVGSFSLSEFGDYTFAGLGGAPTYVAAGATVFATITEVNNLPVAPINIPAANASFSDSLPGPALATPWSLGVLVDVGAMLPVGDVATKVKVVINNSLATGSEPQTASFIAKKGFRIDLVPVEVQNVPEPSTIVLTGLAVCGLGLAASKRR